MSIPMSLALSHQVVDRLPTLEHSTSLRLMALPLALDTCLVERMPKPTAPAPRTALLLVYSFIRPLAGRFTFADGTEADVEATHYQLNRLLHEMHEAMQ